VPRAPLGDIEPPTELVVGAERLLPSELDDRAEEAQLQLPAPPLARHDAATFERLAERVDRRLLGDRQPVAIEREMPRQLVARRAFPHIGPVDEHGSPVGGGAGVGRLDVAMEEARGRRPQCFGERRRVVPERVDGRRELAGGSDTEPLPSLGGEVGNEFGPTEPTFAVQRGVAEPLPARPVRQVGRCSAVVGPRPRRRAEAGQVVDERGVHRFPDPRVTGREQLVAHVAHQQRRAPTVAPETERATDDRMIDKRWGPVEQTGGPGADRARDQVAGHPHREVVVEVDVLEDVGSPLDPHPLEHARRPTVGIVERLPSIRSREQLLHRPQGPHLTDHARTLPGRAAELLQSALQVHCRPSVASSSLRQLRRHKEER
jgi:hypothetical protein